MTRGRRPAGPLHPIPVEPPERLLRLDEVADRTQLSPRTVQREVAEGNLSCIRLGRLVRFRPRDVEAWWDRHASK